jgi:hypothetical protein
MPPNAEAGVVAFRVSPRLLAPDWVSRMHRLGLPLAVLFVALIGYSVVRDRTVQSWAVALAFITVAVAAPSVGAKLYARLSIESGVVMYRGLVGRTHRVPVAEVRRLARIRIAILGPRFAFTRLLLLDEDGRARASVQEEWWQPSELARFQACLGRDADVAAPLLTARRANELYPGAASLALTHRFKIWLAATALIILILADLATYLAPTPR